MAKPWRLTKQAERSLSEIADWTLQKFGPRQARSYEEDLIARCVEIASGAAVSQDCRRLADVLAHESLRFARAGQHFIVFAEMADQVIIVDFLNARSDLPRRLAALLDAQPDDNS